MNPRRKEDFKRLVDAVDSSRKKLSVFRERRKELISKFVGSEYSDNAEAKKVYINLLALAVNIYVRETAVRAPTAKVTTPFEDLKPLAADLTIACQEAADETNLGRTLRRAVTEAFLSPLACVKIGLEINGEKDFEGERVEITDPFIAMVSFDDYVRDMAARSAYNPAFEGDRYTITKKEFDKRYPNSVAGKQDREELDTYDEDGQERAEDISHEVNTGGDETVHGNVEIQDVWLYRERLMVTYLVDKPGDRPLEVKEYDTAEEGPYRTLFFTHVPDNAMPLPPFSLLRNIHDLANSLFRRLASQAQKQKRVVGFNEEESAINFQKAHDGDGMKWKGIKPENIETGGIDQATMGFFIQVKDIFSWVGGNLDSLGGLSPMAETAKQDELLSKSANAQLADMQDATADFAKSIFKQIAWYEWTDPVRTRILEKPIKGTDIVIPVRWDNDTREGDFLDFNFDIIPQSMQDDSPARRAQKLITSLNQVIFPMLPVMQEQGLSLDFQRLTSILSDYTNLPELESIIIPIDPNVPDEDDQPRGNATAVGKPGTTHRTYERINRPGATRVGKDMALSSILFGGNVQKDEKDAIGRPST